MTKEANKEQFAIPVLGINFDFRERVFSSHVPHASVSLSLFIPPCPQEVSKSLINFDQVRWRRRGLTGIKYLQVSWK